MSLALRIVDTHGGFRIIHARPGVPVRIQPGDRVMLADPAQGAALELSRSGTDLVVTGPEGALTLRGFYTNPGPTPPMFELSVDVLADYMNGHHSDARQGGRHQKDPFSTALLLEDAGGLVGPSSLGSALQQNALIGLHGSDASSLPEDRSSASLGIRPSRAGFHTLAPESDGPVNADILNRDHSPGHTIHDFGIVAILPSEYSVSASSVREGAAMTFTVTRIGGLLAPGSVQYATSAGTADTGDFSATSGTITFGAGESTRTFTVPTTADWPLTESDETFTVTLSNPSNNGKLGAAASAIGTIIDNNPPTASADSVAVNEDAASPNLVSAMLSNDTDPDAGDSLTVSGVNTVGTIGTVSFNAASQTLTYTAQNFDALAEGQVTTDTFAYTARDGGDATSTATVTLTVTGVNDAPIVVAGGGVAYTENAAPASIDTTITLSDIDGTSLVGATGRITGNFTTGDTLSFTDTGTITGTYNTATGVLTLSGIDTLVNYETALRAVQFNSTSDDPTAISVNRIVSWQLDDGASANNASAAGTSTVVITPIDDAPTAVNLNGAQSYIEDTPLNLTDIVISDPDSANVTAMLTLSNPLAGSLSSSTVTSTYNASTGIWTASGTLAVVNAELADLIFTPALNFNGNITVATAFSDGTTGIVGSVALTGVGVNDAPTATNLSAPESYTEDTALNLIDIVASDVDNTSVTATITMSNPLAGILSTGTSGAVTSSFDAVAGVWTANGALTNVNVLLAGITFNPALNFNGNFNITTQVSDGALAVSGTKSMIGTAVNDPPTATNLSVPQTYTEDTSLNLVNVVVSDVDSGTTTVTFTLSNPLAGSLSIATSGAVTSTYNASTGVWTGSGAIIDVNTLLAGLTFTPTLNFNSNLIIATTVTDGASLPVSGSISLTGVPVIDPPSATNLNVPETYTEDTALNLTDIVVGAVDTAGVNVTLTLSNAAAGALSTATSGVVTSSYNAGTGVWAAAGLIADINVLLAGVTFTPTLNFNGSFNIATLVSDGVAPPLTGSKTVVGTAVNDPVVNTVPGAQFVNEDTSLTINGISMADPDITGPMLVTLSAVTGVLTLSQITGLSFTTGNGTSDTSMTFSGVLADVNAAVAGLGYLSPLDFHGADTITLTSNDQGSSGSGAIGTDSKSIAVTIRSVNDAPLAANLNAAQTYTEDTTLNLTDIVITDPDSGDVLTATLTLDAGARAAGGSFVTATSGTVTSTYNTATGAWSASGDLADVNILLAGVTFTPGANYNSAVTISTSVTDNVAAAVTGSKTLTGAAVNDAPTATNLSTSEAILANTPTDLTDIVVTDVDSATVTVTLTLDNLAASLSTATSNAVTSTYNPGTGVWSASGLIADVNTVLASAAFDPPPGLTPPDVRIATSVSDGVAAAVTGSKLMSLVPNNPPTAANLNVAEAYTEDTALNLTDIVVGDVDYPTFPNVSATLTMSNPAAGALSIGTSHAVTSAYDTGTGVWTASGDLIDVNALLQGLTFNPALNFNGAFTMTTAINDGIDLATGSPGSKLFTGAAVNDAPVNSVPASQTVNEDTTLTVTGVSVTDVDATGAMLVTVSSTNGVVSLSQTTGLSFTAGDGTGDSTMTFTGLLANVNAALNNLTYVAPANFNGMGSITLVSSDQGSTGSGGAKSDTDVIPVTILPVNDPPTAANLNAAETYTEDTPLNLVDVVASDIDSATIVATLTLSNPLAGTVSTATSGAVASGYNAATGVWTASGALANVNILLAGVTFTPTLNFNGDLNISTRISDGSLAVFGSKAMTGTAVDDAPTAINLSTAQSYIEDTPLDLTNILISDVDSTNVTAALTLSIPGAGTLSTGTSGSVTSTYNPVTGAWAASGAIADVNSLLGGVIFNPTATFNSSFTIATSVSDGVAAPITGSKAITGIGVNNPPTATSLSVAETYIEDTSLNLTDIVVSDIDSADISATLTLSAPLAGAISTATSGTVTSAYNAATGVWTASGAIANVNALLAGATFTPAANFNGNFSVGTSVSDGVAAALTGSKNFTGTAVNDAPTASNLSAPQSYTEDTPLSLTGIVVSDIDSTNTTVTLTLSNIGAGALSTGTSGAVTSTYAAGSGVWSAAGAITDVNTLLGSVTFTPTLNFSSNFSIATSVSDSVAAPATGTKAITGVSVNDPPTATNLSAAETYTEDTALNLTDIVVTDVDSASVIATLTLSNIAAGMLSTATSGVVTSTFNVFTGVWQASGAIANVNTLLAGVLFTPLANFNGNLNISTSISDGIAGAIIGSKATIGTAVNDAPVNTVPGAQTVSEDTNVTLAGISIADVDASNAEVTLSAAHGALTLSQTTGLSFTVGDGTADSSMTFSGSLASINAAESNMVYRANSNYNGSDTITLTTSDLGGTGAGGTLTDVDTIGVTVTAVNDAPVNTVPGAQTVNEDTNLTVAGISVTDTEATNVQVTIAAAHGIMSLFQLTGLTFSAGDGSSDGTMTFAGTIANVNAALDNLVYRGALNFNGADTITLTTSDLGSSGAGGTLTDVDTIGVTVAAVNDAPVNTVPGAQTVNEDTNLTFSSNAVSISDVDAASITVTVAAANGVLSLSQITGLTFTTGDGTSDATMTFAGTVTSVNAALNNLIYRGNFNYNGADTITLTTSDLGSSGAGGTLTDVDTIGVTVTAVNDPPVNTVPVAQSVNEDTNLTVAGISVADTEAATIQISIAATGGVLSLFQLTGLTFTAGDGTSDGTMTFSGTIANVNAALDNLVYRGTLNFNGADTITLTTSDLGATGAGGALTDIDSIGVTVAAVNDAPVNTVPGAQTVNEDTNLTFSSNAVSISDVDAASITVTVAAINGALSLSQITGLSFSTGDGTSDATMTFAGTVTNVNAALNNLIYRGNANYNGADTITLTTSDLGSAGAGGTLTDADSIGVTINAVNDAPTATSLSTSEGYQAGVTLDLTNIVVTDPDSGNTITATLTLSDLAAGSLTTGGPFGAVTPIFAGGVWTGSGSVTDVNAALAAVSYAPAGGYSSAFTIATSVTDSVAAPVTGVKSMSTNQPPTATNLNAAESYTEDVASQALSDIVVSDVDSPNVTMTLTISNLAAGSLSTGTSGAVTSTFGAGVWSASGAIANVNILLAGVTFSPSANFNSNFTIATSVTDGSSGPTIGSKAMTGVPVNDPPTASNMSAAETYTEDTALNLTNIVVSDIDVSDTITATLTLSNVAAGALSTSTSGVVTSTYNAGTGVWIAAGPVADVNSQLAAVTFTPAANFASGFTITTRVRDSAVTGPADGSKTFTGIAVNDAPSASNLSSAETYTEDTNLNLTDIVITDPDLGDVITATLTLSNAAAGSLTTATSGAVTSTYSAGTGIWSASGALANVNTLLAGVTFTPTLNFNSNFTITTSVSDGVASAVTGIKAVTGTAVNDAPVNTVAGAQNVNEDTNLTIAGISIADAEAASIQVSVAATNGVVSLSQLTGLTFGAGDGTSDATMTFSGTKANVNAALNNLVYRANLNYNGADTITLTTSDLGASGSGGTLTDTDTIAVTVSAVNDAPVNTVAGAQTVAEDTNLTVAGISVADVDATTLQVTVAATNGVLTLSQLTGLTFGAGDGTSDATMTFSGATANVNAALNNLVYRGNLNYNGADTITLTTSDLGATGSGGTFTDTDTVGVTVTAVNDAPTATSLSVAETYIENTALNLIDIVVSDVDSPTVTATLTLSNVTAGSLSTATSGAVTSTFAAGVWTASGALANVNTLLAGVTFTPTTDFNGNFNIATSVSDGVAAAITGSKALTGTAVDNPPTAINLSAAETYTEDTVLNLTNIIASDVDSANLTATLTLSNLAAGSLSTATSGAVTSTFAAGVWSASGAIANVNTLLAGVTFTPTSDFNSSFTIGTSVSDGVAAALTGIKAMTGIAINDAPVNTVPGAQTVNEDTNLTVAAVSVADVDSVGLMLVTLSATNGVVSLSQTTGLSFTTGDGTNDATMTFTGSLVNANAALNNLVFLGNPNINGAAGITLTSSDQGSSGSGGVLTDTDTIAITVTSVNDAPTAANLSGSETYSEDTARNLTDIVVSDVDSANVTATLTLSDVAAGTLSTATSGTVTSTFAAGVWSASGALADVNALLAGVTFTPTSNYNSNFTIATSVSDGIAAPITGSKVMTGIPMNDAPSATSLSAAQTYTEDTALNLTDIVVSDVDSASVTATLTLSAPVAGSLSTATSGSVTSTYNVGSGQWSASGALADVNILLAGVTFNPTANFNGNFNIATSVSDGVAAPITGSKAITGTAVNDAPSAINLNAADAYSINTAANLTDIVVTDVDSPTVTATLTLSNLAAGALSTATSGAVTSTFAGGVWSASGAIANVNTLLAGVTFTPALNFNSNFTITTSVSDGVAAALTGSKAITVTANSPPTATSLGTAESYTEDTALNLTDIVITDVDSTNVTATLTLSTPAAGALSTATSGSVTSTYNVGSGVWTASGLLANVNVLLAGVIFNPAANFNANFNIATSVSDGIAAPVTGSKAMTGSAVNDAPLNTVPVAQTVAEDTNLTINGISIADVDAVGPLLIVVSATNGVVSLSQTTGLGFTLGDGSADSTMTFTGSLVNVNAALAGLLYRGNLNYNGSDTITLIANDQGSAGSGGAKSDTDSIAVTVTAVNDPPTATNLSAAETYTEDTALNLTDIVVTDVDSVAVTATLTLSAPAAGALSTATSGTVTSTYNAGTGVWTASGAIANVDTLLAAVIFTPTANFNGNFNIATSVSDGVAAPITGSKAMTGTAVNDAPINTVPGAQSATQGSNTTIAGISVADVDAAAGLLQETLSVTIGALTLSTTAGLTFSSGDGISDATMTFTGALANINAALSNLIYNSGAFSGSTTITLASNDQGNIGSGGALSDTDTIGVAVTTGVAPTTTVNLSTLNGTAGFKMVGEFENGVGTGAPGVGLGSAVGSAGDVNGDGYADMIIGAYHEDPNSTLGNGFNSGQAFVVFGGANLSTTLAGANTTNGYDSGLLSGSSGFKVNGTASQEKLAYAVGGADLNGDGYSDVLVTAFPQNSADFSAVIAGDTTAHLDSNLAGASTTAGFNVTGATGSLGAIFQGSVTNNAMTIAGVGDMNGDGRDELLIGDALAGASGTAFLVFGNTMSNLQSLPLNTTNSGGTVLKFIGASGSSLGGAVASADLNGDGIPDLIIGAATANGNTGAVYVVYGGSTLTSLITNNATSHILDSGFNLTTLTGTNGFVINGDATLASSGFVFTGVAITGAGDFNADGIDDIAISAPYTHAPAGDFAGRVYIVYGQLASSPNHFTSSLSLASGSLTSSKGLTITGEIASGQLGFSIGGGGDVNGDGYSDIVIGMPGISTPPNKAYVIYGNSMANLTSQFNGTFDLTANDSTINGSNALLLKGATGDVIGSAVAIAGDVNSDGYADVLIGAVNGNITGFATNLQAGITYLVYGGNLSGLSTTALGTSGAPIVATADNTTVVGRLGNDFLSSAARTGNTLLGGAGDDTLTINGSEQRADGGGGSDTLKLFTSGENLDFTALAQNKYTSIENIDLRGGGTNTLTITPPDLLDLSSESHTLYVRGDAADWVTRVGTGWVAGSDLTTGGATYHSYTVTNSTAHLYVETTVGGAASSTSINLATLNGTAGFKLNGPNDPPYVHAGSSVANAGDVNGDGYADLFIGASHALHPGAIAGQAYIVFGNTTSFLTTNVANGTTGFNLVNLSGAATPFLGFKINGPSPGRAFIGQVAGGDDINGDGYADVLTGSNTALGSLTPNPANAYVVFGNTPANLAAVATTASQPGSATAIAGSTGYDLTNANGSAAALLRGNPSLSLNLFAVAEAGDLNGDGRSEIILGQLDGNSNAGQVYLVYGDTGANLQALTTAGNGLNSAVGVLKFNGAAASNAGESVASAGDVNADGIPDLIIGAPAANGGRGGAYVVYGGTYGNLSANLTNATSTGFALSTLHGGTNGAAGQPMGFTITGLADSAGLITNAMAGYSVASAGDFNGDGVDDMIIGAPAPTGAAIQAGEAFIVYGQRGGFAGDIDLGSLNPLTTGFAIIGGRYSPGSHAGGSVAGAGDVNGDGYADVLIGATGDNEAYLIYGAPGATWAPRITNNIFGGFTSGINAFKVASLGPDDSTSVGQGPAHTSLLDGINGTLLVGTAGTNAGISVSGGGDINNDGYSDILIGADFTNSNLGQAFVVYGGNLSGLSTTALGTSGAPILAAANNTTVVGALGNDFLSSNSFAGITLLGGAGDDTLTINGSDQRAAGGGGNDTLKLASSGQNLDFTALAQNKYTSIENIDLRGTGANGLTLTASDLLDLSSTSHALFVRGEAADSVTSAAQGWVQGADQVVAAVTYHSYTIANSAAHLLIENAITSLTIS